MDIGLIAGGGQFPELFAKRASELGHNVFAVGFKTDTAPDLKNLVHHIEYQYLGQIGKLIQYFKKKHISQVVMLGTIQKSRALTSIRPDFKMLKFIAKTTLSHDDKVLSALADLLHKEGIEIISSTSLLPDLLSPCGVWTRKKPDTSEKKDIRIGWEMAGKIGDMDIGQCIVISNGSVLAVEAIDGTDATILRGGNLASGQGAVVIKRCKPNQDLRFDLPASGLKTIEIMKQSGVDFLVLEAGKSISFDREKMIHFADQNHIGIAAYTDEDLP